MAENEEWAEIDVEALKKSANDDSGKVEYEIEGEVDEPDSTNETVNVKAEKASEEVSKEDTTATSEETSEEKVSQSEDTLPELDGINTKGAEKRIRQLVRQRKEREEELKAAQQENNTLREELKVSKYSHVSSEEATIKTTEQHLKDQMAMAQNNFKSAFEGGDQEKLVEAQTALTQAQTELRFLQDRKQYVENEKALLDYEDNIVPEGNKKQSQYKRPPDVKAREWAERNEWFGKDRVLTASALAIDSELKELGYDPNSDEFYEMVDQKLRKEIPNKFSDEPESEVATPQKPRQTVAGQSRSSASAKKIRLNQEDIRLAKKWNIPIETYAAEKAKMEKADGDYTTIN